MPILAAPLLFSGAAFGQAAGTAPPQNSLPADKAQALDGLKQHDEELKGVREQQRQSAEAEAALKREIEEIGADRRKLAQDMIDTAARLRGVEAKVEATQQRLKPLNDNEDTIRKSLDGRRAVIAEVLAALQRMGRRPPPALIASPEDALQSVRTAMLLGAVLPDMRDKVEALGARSRRTRSTSAKSIAAERDALRAKSPSLDDERTRMAALIEERQKQQTEREQALAAERSRAGELARQADNLKDLIAKLEQGLDRARSATRREAARSR